ncbi:hypothetical protein [Peribacillus sp. SI8-4]|uniref:hypothetical protein n=1 Tax=Peribacillus sp. SI8-4 TaxID=3048009 RepID=UPI002556BD5D|nr:hypothetical protein [Peribacillus sp. SI8-4]
MGSVHEFYLIARTTDTKDFWMYKESGNGVMDSAVIDDDLILYIMDSLEWIPSQNPAKRGNPSGRGINYHGVTLFDRQASKTLMGIFMSWKNLFKNAPASFVLPGAYVYGDKQEGNYEKLVFSRDEVIAQLDKMISMSEALAKGECYLYHCGI